MSPCHTLSRCTWQSWHPPSDLSEGVSFYLQFIKCSKWENVLQFLPRRVVFIMLRLSFVVEIPIGRSKNSMQVRRWNDSGQSLHIVHFILTRAGISNLWLYWGSGDQSWNIVTRREEKPICMQRSDKCDAGLQDTLHHGQTHEPWHLVFGTCMGWDLSIKASWSERLWHICKIDKQEILICMMKDLLIMHCCMSQVSQQMSDIEQQHFMAEINLTRNCHTT